MKLFEFAIHLNLRETVYYNVIGEVESENEDTAKAKLRAEYGESINILRIAPIKTSVPESLFGVPIQKKTFLGNERGKLTFKPYKP